MSADDHLSPGQFGFREASHSDWNTILDQGYHQQGRPGRIDPNMDLYTGQKSMSQEIVDHYAGQKSPQAGHPVEIYHNEGKAWAGDGHHRIAAARLKGQKSIRVMHYGK